MNEEQISFFFVTKNVVFQEVAEKFARIEATVMELDKASEGNNRIYQIEEGSDIAKSLIGKPVYYGVTPLKRHDNPLVKEDSQKEPVGLVEFAEVVGKKIKAKIKIFNESIIETLKAGTKYLFSVGGHAVKETLKKMGEKIIHILHGAKCNHLQLVDVGTPVGFPNAQMEKLIEIQETIMMCQGGVCGNCTKQTCDGNCQLPKKQKLNISEIECDSSFRGYELE